MEKEMMLTLDQLEEITGGAFDTPEEKQILDACLMRVSQRIDEGILPKEAMVEQGHVITEYTKKIRDTGPPRSSERSSIYVKKNDFLYTCVIGTLPYDDRLHG